MCLRNNVIAQAGGELALDISFRHLLLYFFDANFLFRYIWGLTGGDKFDGSIEMSSIFMT